MNKEKITKPSETIFKLDKNNKPELNTKEVKAGGDGKTAEDCLFEITTGNLANIENEIWVSEIDAIKAMQTYATQVSAEKDKRIAELEKQLEMAPVWLKATMCQYLLKLPSEIMVKYGIDADEMSEQIDRALKTALKER